MKFTKGEDCVERGVVLVRHTVTREEYQQMVGWCTFEKCLEKNATQAQVAEMLDTLLSNYLASFDPEDQGYEPGPETPPHLWLLGEA